MRTEAISRLAAVAAVAVLAGCALLALPVFVMAQRASGREVDAGGGADAKERAR